MIVILGPTASGKTSLAVALASQLNGEVISADSRQVYRNMDIGSGKDLLDYGDIPYHLIDIAEPGDLYNVYQYQKDFKKVYSELLKRNKKPILCGGTGMYLDSILKGYHLVEVPHNENLRNILDQKTDEELINQLSKMKSLHNTTDSTSRDRLIRALEIVLYYKENNIVNDFPKIRSKVFGIRYDRSVLRTRITERLEKRLNSGMVEEVKYLRENKKMSLDQFKYYGLEYKLVGMYVFDQLGYQEMFEQLNTAIHKFAKRQMTWFRRMERNGIPINWIDGDLTLSQKMEYILLKSHINGV